MDGRSEHFCASFQGGFAFDSSLSPHFFVKHEIFPLPPVQSSVWVITHVLNSLADHLCACDLIVLEGTDVRLAVGRLVSWRRSSRRTGLSWEALCFRALWRRRSE